MSSCVPSPVATYAFNIVSRDPRARRVVHNSHARHLFRKPDSPKFPIPFRFAMASAANNFVNLIITGDEDSQMDGRDDPAQEERQEEMYTHVFEGQSISRLWRQRNATHD